MVARYINAPALGLNNANSLEAVPSTGGTSETFFGGEDDMYMTASWFG
jgi:hypothetical protein